MKSLPEQGLTEDDVLLLRKKFFVNDPNIDREDPVQLHLLYVQSRDGILKGTHPVTLTEAIQFGALQMQVEQGNYDPQKHKIGSTKYDHPTFLYYVLSVIRLPAFLPLAYIKKKKIEKDLLQEYRKLTGMADVNAK